MKQQQETLKENHQIGKSTSGVLGIEDTVRRLGFAFPRLGKNKNPNRKRKKLTKEQLRNFLNPVLRENIQKVTL